MRLVLLLQILGDLSLYFAFALYLLKLAAGLPLAFKALLYLLPVLYLFFFKKTDLANSYNSQKDHFFSGLRLLPFLLLAVWLTLDLNTLENTVLPFIVVYLITNTLLLNILRHDQVVLQSKQFKLINIGILILSIGLCFELSQGWLHKPALALLSLLRQYVLTPLFLGISYSIGWIIWLISQGIAFLVHKSGTTQEPFQWKTVPSTALEWQNREALTLPTWFATLKIIIAIIIIALIFFIILRRLLSRQGRQSGVTGVYQYRESIDPPRQPATRFNKLWAPRDPGLAIRYYYRKFLILCCQQGITINPKSTSTMIHQAAQTHFDRQSSADLQQLYIKARYAKDQPQPAEARRFKQIYHDLKNTKGREGAK